MKDITVISATSDSIILFFSSVSRCLFDIPFTGAFAKRGIVLLLTGRDLVSREECVPARLSMTSLFRKAAFASPFPYRRFGECIKSSCLA